MDPLIEQIMKEISLAGLQHELNLSSQLFRVVAGPPPTEAQLVQWKLEREERERKAQEELERRFLGKVVGVSESYDSITLTYEDGRVERIDTGSWNEDY